MVIKRGKRYGGPWYREYKNLVNFERNMKDNFPSIRSANIRTGHEIWREYNLIMDVPEYESRQVTIRMKPNRANAPKVTVDGSTDSPHRYKSNDDALCIWHPCDPKDNKWLFSDGLLPLLVLIQAHLFREAYWREKGEWLGPEYPHNPN